MLKYYLNEYSPGDFAFDLVLRKPARLEPSYEQCRSWAVFRTEKYMAELEVTGRKYVSHAKAAKIRGVSTRTLDRWIVAGIIPRPERINGRKYHQLHDIERIKMHSSASIGDL
jgi:hypothetical protein